MRISLFFWLLILCGTLPGYAQEPLLPSLSGTWYVVQTNFPMWTTGKKTRPAFRYTVAEQNGRKGLIDSVVYIQNGQMKSITGFDVLTDSAAMRFTWRGRGVLSLLRSRWQMVWLSPDRQWAVIAFDKTLFTPAGYDVISRSKRPDPLMLKAIAAKLAEMGIGLAPVDQE